MRGPKRSGGWCEPESEQPETPLGVVWPKV